MSEGSVNNLSNTKSYQNRGQDIYYLCYVQNYLGILDGEDVISNVHIFTEQSKIDDWFRYNIRESKELGFIPEDHPSTYIGMNDFECVLSKGNDEEGYESYGIVCRPCILND